MHNTYDIGTWIPSFDMRREIHVKVNPLQINMRCRCCCKFIANNSISINLFQKKALRWNIKESIRWKQYGGIIVKDENVRFLSTVNHAIFICVCEKMCESIRVHFLIMMFGYINWSPTCWGEKKPKLQLSPQHRRNTKSELGTVISSQKHRNRKFETP